MYFLIFQFSCLLIVPSNWEYLSWILLLAYSPRCLGEARGEEEAEVSQVYKMLGIGSHKFLAHSGW